MSVDPARATRHELRTPVDHILGCSELLLEEAGAGLRVGAAQL